MMYRRSRKHAQSLRGLDSHQTWLDNWEEENRRLLIEAINDDGNEYPEEYIQNIKTIAISYWKATICKKEIQKALNDFGDMMVYKIKKYSIALEHHYSKYTEGKDNLFLLLHNEERVKRHVKKVYKTFLKTGQTWTHWDEIYEE